MEEKKKIETIEDCVTANGLLISGQGMIANNTDKMIEILDKIQKFLFFMERRQKEMFEWMQKNLNTSKD